jgi:hypothetical protein
VFWLPPGEVCSVGSVSVIGASRLEEPDNSWLLLHDYLNLNKENRTVRKTVMRTGTKSI